MTASEVGAAATNVFAEKILIHYDFRYQRTGNGFAVLEQMLPMVRDMRIVTIWAPRKLLRHRNMEKATSAVAGLFRLHISRAHREYFRYLWMLDGIYRSDEVFLELYAAWVEFVNGLGLRHEILDASVQDRMLLRSKDWFSNEILGSRPYSSNVWGFSH